MTTRESAAATKVSYQFETLWDFAYDPTHRELEVLYETAKRNQWNSSTAIDWSRPVGREGPVLNVRTILGAPMYPGGPPIYEMLTDEQRQEMEIKVSAWRLSQFLHGEQGALLVAGQLVNALPDLDGKLYAATQTVDEGRHVEVFERYVKKLHRIYPVDPVLKALIEEILSSPLWEVKLLGMQMMIEALAIAAFGMLRHETGDPTLRSVLDYVLQDEGRHVNFGYFALKRSAPAMDSAKRLQLEQFAWHACDVLYVREQGAGFGSIRTVFAEMGWDGDVLWPYFVKSPSIQNQNRVLFNEMLIPRLKRLGLLSERIEPDYRALGLVEP